MYCKKNSFAKPVMRVETIMETIMETFGNHFCVVIHFLWVHILHICHHQRRANKGN